MAAPEPGTLEKARHVAQFVDAQILPRLDEVPALLTVLLHGVEDLFGKVHSLEGEGKDAIEIVQAVSDVVHPPAPDSQQQANPNQAAGQSAEIAALRQQVEDLQRQSIRTGQENATTAGAVPATPATSAPAASPAAVDPTPATEPTAAPPPTADAPEPDGDDTTPDQPVPPAPPAGA